MPASASQKRRRLADRSHTFHVSLDDFQQAQTSMVVIDSVSSDCRRTFPQEYEVLQPVPRFFEPIGFNDSSYDSPWDLPEIDGQDPVVAPPPKRYDSSDDQLYEWTRYRAEYLDEMLFLDGFRGFSRDQCPTCSEPAEKHPPVYRCQDCFIGQPVCKSCCLAGHLQHPLHVIECWNGNFFSRTSLKALGLRVLLGHSIGSPCSNSRPGPQNFYVFHVNGIHEVAVDFCDCDKKGDAGNWRVQCLRREWFPATQKNPETCCTFRVMEHFHLQTLQAKTTAHDYCIGLAKLTDNTGTSKQLDIYKTFLRVVRQWRHIKMLKRGGRGHDPRRVEGTVSGELAVECPACPRPGVNLPEGWESVPEKEKYLYLFIVAIDACFRLKRRITSSEKKDPGFGSGWAYFVEDEPYRQYLLTVTDQDEMSTCSGLSALDHANSKFSRGYATTGVGVGMCARHEFIQKNGVGDLQKGERYSNMDFIFASILRHHDPKLPKVASYDIACQWSIHLLERIKKLPPLVRLQIILQLTFAIPKLHIYGHKLQCQVSYSLHLHPGVGNTDGEGIERSHAFIGPLGTSTQEMGPGSRHDTLDDAWGYWNWLKLITLGHVLKKRLDGATRERDNQQISFEAFTTQQAEHVQKWRELVDGWETGRHKDNPYSLPQNGATESEVRVKLLQQEAELAKEGLPPLHTVTPSNFVVYGLGLEEEQRRVKNSVKEIMTFNQKADVLEQRTRLSQNLHQFRTLQATYMPVVAHLLQMHPASASDQPEDVTLYLPSELSSHQLSRCVPALLDIEKVLREAQCNTTIERLRNQLFIKSRYLVHKGLHLRHQAANTRARALLDRNERKIRLHAAKYRDARAALLRMHGDNISRFPWEELKQEDIRCMEDSEALEKCANKEVEREAYRTSQEGTDAPDIYGNKTTPGEGRRTLSWIWMAAASNGAEAELHMHDAVCVEWLKAFARTNRWVEEVNILKEEMQRTLESHAHKAEWWRARREGSGRVWARTEYVEGARAYADKQVLMYETLARNCKQIWAARSSSSDEDVDLESIVAEPVVD